MYEADDGGYWTKKRERRKEEGEKERAREITGHDETRNGIDVLGLLHWNWKKKRCFNQMITYISNAHAT